MWTWTGIEADSKMIAGYFVGGRDARCANCFMNDLASRLSGRIEMTTDDHNPDLAHVSTSYVECENLTMPISMRRFTGLDQCLLKEDRQPRSRTLDLLRALQRHAAAQVFARHFCDSSECVR